MVSCQGNKSASRRMHTSAGPSQHPSGELFLPCLSRKQTLNRTVAGTGPCFYCKHLVRVLSPFFFWFSALGLDYPEEQVCLPSNSFLTWLASLVATLLSS